MNNNQITHGIFFALLAYVMWGIAPLYFKQLTEVPAMEILMHRIIWSGLILLVLVSLLKQWPKVRYALKNKKTLLVLLASSVLIGVNWTLFIWAVNNDHLLDASLGYYINPLLNVFLGRIFLAERLKKLQKIAVLIALSGVLIQVVLFGQVPWLALALASSFGFYGLLRKRVPVDALPGLLIETMMMLPLAVIYWALFASTTSNMLTNEFNYNALLIAAGAVTIAPLLCFTAAARRLPLSTLGFMQFIGPTLMFILAVNIYGEALEISKLISFSFIWLGLGVFIYDVLRQKS